MMTSQSDLQWIKRRWKYEFREARNILRNPNRVQDRVTIHANKRIINIRREEITDNSHRVKIVFSIENAEMKTEQWSRKIGFRYMGDNERHGTHRDTSESAVHALKCAREWGFKLPC